MIKNFLLFFLYFSLAMSVSANENDFAKAEKLYSQEKYEEALKVFSSLLEENEISPVVFYNMGNCYFQTGDYLNALLYYERAHKYDPSNEEILENMEITRSRLSDKSDEMSSGISGWFYNVVNSRPADYWSYLAIGLSMTGTVLLFLMLFSTQISLKRMSLATALISFVFALVFSVFSFYQISYFNAEDDALIMELNTEVKKEADEDSKSISILPAGIKVKIIDEKGEWSEISINSRTGWVKTSSIVKI